MSTSQFVLSIVVDNFACLFRNYRSGVSKLGTVLLPVEAAHLFDTTIPYVLDIRVWTSSMDAVLRLRRWLS